MPLPYESLALAIRNGQVAPCYLLAGPDGLQQRAVVDALAARVPDLGRQRLDGRALGPAELAGMLRTSALVPGRLVIVDEPPWVLPASGGAEAEQDAPSRAKVPPDKPLLDYLDAPAPDATLVLRTAGEVDRRRRLTKKAIDRGVFLDASPPRESAGWLRERCRAAGVALGADAFALVLQRLAGATCERMASEVDKLAAYGQGLNREALDRLLPPDHQERIFDLVDAAVAGQARALGLAAALLAQGEAAARLLYSLGSHLRTIAVVADACGGGQRPEAVAGALGLHPFVARKALDQSRRLAAPAVAAAAEAVWEAEFALKTGRLEEGPACDHAVLGILRAAGALPGGGPRAGARRRGGEVPSG